MCVRAGNDYRVLCIFSHRCLLSRFMHYTILVLFCIYIKCIRCIVLFILGNTARIVNATIFKNILRRCLPSYRLYTAYTFHCKLFASSLISRARSAIVRYFALRSCNGLHSCAWWRWHIYGLLRGHPNNIREHVHLYCSWKSGAYSEGLYIYKLSIQSGRGNHSSCAPGHRAMKNQ